MKNVLPEEKLNECREVFDLFDKDKTGEITIDDLRNVINLLGDFPTDEDLKNIIKEVDLDGSNKVEFDEFVQIY